MSGERTVVRQAPGKLFVAGEYAVVEPGNPALLAAVDRCVTATVTGVPTGGAEVEVVSALAPRTVRLRRGERGLVGRDAEDARLARERLAPLVSAVEVVDELLAERGLPRPSLRIAVDSGLHQDGRKYGLGSSGAVTVATLDAVAAWWGVELSRPEDRYRLALLASARLNPAPSGGDLAASAFGGWLRYRSPDRAAVLEVARHGGVEEALRTPWPGLEIRRLPPPTGLTVEVGWTRRPASTASQVADLRTRNWRGGAAHQRFLERSAACVEAAAEALDRGEADGLLSAVRRARWLLAGLESEAGISVFTRELTALCDAAEQCGGAGKPSGAGGGDCGVALLPAAAELSRLRAHWAAAGVAPLPVRTADGRDAMSAERKDDHVRLAVEQQHGLRERPDGGQRPGGHSEFDDVSFVHHALAGTDRSAVSLRTGFGGVEWPVPLYINAMTGGSEKTGAINRDLAVAARETGVPIASGSVSAYFKDPSCAGTFSVLRRENPDGFVMANVNATVSAETARRAVDLLEADALQIHLNSIQETVMPEGDRAFSSWGKRIEEIAGSVGVPVIVKEVGFGLSRETVLVLRDMGVSAADVSGRGGTDFARIEDGRRERRDYAYLDGWGQSTPACLLDAQGAGLPLLASGGVRHPLDVARALALGASAAGASGGFLRTLLDGGVPALVAHLTSWLEQLTALMTALGARTPAELGRCDLLVGGGLRTFCADRDIDTRRLATRSRHHDPIHQTTGGTR